MPVGQMADEGFKDIFCNGYRRCQQSAAGGTHDGRQQRTEKHDLGEYRRVVEDQIGQDVLRVCTK